MTAEKQVIKKVPGEGQVNVLKREEDVYFFYLKNFFFKISPVLSCYYITPVGGVLVHNSILDMLLSLTCKRMILALLCC